jgi:hypothetical protein
VHARFVSAAGIAKFYSIASLIYRRPIAAILLCSLTHINAELFKVAVIENHCQT